MACERCRRLCAPGGCTLVRSLILLQLAFVLLGSSPVIAEPDSSYYNYDVVSRWNLEGDETPQILHTKDSSLRSAETIGAAAAATAAVVRRRRNLGRERPESSEVAEAVSEPSLVKTGNGSSDKVTYSTENVTANNSSAIQSRKESTAQGTATTVTTTTIVQQTPVDAVAAVTAAGKTEDAKTSKTGTAGVIVSQPMNPVTGQPVIWANQTRWDNATRKTDDKNPNAGTIEGVAATTASRAAADKPEKKVDDEKSEAKMDNGTSDKSTVASPPGGNVTDGELLGDMSISKFSDVTNNTLVQNNITKTEEDTHQYYNSTFFSDETVAKMYWVDMDKHPDRKVNDLLSASHRRAATVKLTFDFPFYGHKVRNITIATGGFLYTGEYVHSWLAATQYIAPLMANFDTRISRDSWVKYADNGTAFTVEWEEVVLQDKPEAGGFTFQATLHENGNIVFVYSKIPLTVEAIEDTAHPVKVGLSDAYIMDRTIFFVRRKTIYEYHRVNFNRQEIKNWTVIYLRALPTCLEMDNCNDCLTKVPEFDCKWCPELRQCSTGTFRFRQDWLEKGCEQRNIKEPSSCPATQTSYTENLDTRDHSGQVHVDAGLSASVDENSMEPKGGAAGAASSAAAAAAGGNAEANLLDHTPAHMNMGVSGIIGILVIVSFAAGLAAWAGYAYRNPHSVSGQMLIRYRPSQWSWRRGEARYTAATIHM